MNDLKPCPLCANATAKEKLRMVEEITLLLGVYSNHHNAVIALQSCLEAINDD